MKQDNLEDFINQHREEFDSAVPSLKSWAEIDKQLQPKTTAKRFSIKRLSRIAAAAVLLLLIGIAIGLYSSKPKVNQLASLSDISTEYAEMETYYKRQVNQKKAQLASYKKDNIVNQDLEQLDEIMLELQEDFKNAPKGSEEMIINAMIKNYKTKLMILEHVLEDIETKESKNKKDETINI